MVTLFFLAFLPLRGQAQDNNQRYSEIIAKAETLNTAGVETILVATEIKMAKDWHVYWKNPGDSGLPVQIEWDLPEEFEIGNIQWPTPDKISYDILVNYGYYDTLVLLQELKIPKVFPEGPIHIKGKVNVLICNEICIPESSDLSLILNDPAAIPENLTAYFEQAKSKMPESKKGVFEYYEIANHLVVTITPQDQTILADVIADKLEFFPEQWGVLHHVAMPTVTIEGPTITIKHQRGDQSLDQFENITGLLVVKGEEKGQNLGFQLTLTEAKNPPVAPENNQQKQTQEADTDVVTDITWFTAIYLALLGGIILNLMPCVFPVLSMKALSLVKMGDKENTVARKHGLAYTAGIVLSFLIIGGIIVLLKEAGTTVGWGFQFQNPIVISLLVYLLFLIGLNLFGFFEFSFGLSNIGNNLTKGSNLFSSFFTGVLATIVATPCTAPFMGVALGFAITQPAATSMSVFAALGFGLALPYLVLSFVPQFRSALPKPGPWMDVFKQFLAFPIFASVIWLVWVLSELSGSHGVLLVLLGMLAISFCVWLSHLKSRGIGKLVITFLIIPCLMLPLISLAYLGTENRALVRDFSEPFSNEKLAELLEGNQEIFVEMTAAWCITCKVNHAIAINVDSTRALFEERNIQYLIGDWTHEDDQITQYLKKFGRNGVPLYVYYPARDAATGKRPDPKVLPQVLTPAIVKEAIEGA
ncbi:MAG: disulfide bond formation protein DsbD [Alphaproteobacteria bacterium]|nr:disulfide bond formation protein DsbD [Alphaproteobacteria bacterium]